MAQVCPRCRHVHEGRFLYRCPECKAGYDASLFEVPRLDPTPADLDAPAGWDDDEPEPAAPAPPPVEPRRPPADPRPKHRPPVEAEPAARRPDRVPSRDPGRVRSRPRSDEPAPDRRPPEPPSEPPRPLEIRDTGHTIGIAGFDISKLNIAQKRYDIELPDRRGEWAKLYSIVGTVRTPAFGRNIDSRSQEMRWLARKHVRFENTSRGLYLTPYDTINGVYRMIKGPTPLLPDVRFRIGNFILTYRDDPSPEPGEPRVHEGEQLLARDLKPTGTVELLRPDGRFGVRFPLLKPSGVALGRGGVDHEGREAFVDLPLTGDPKVSPRHARISWPRGPDEPPVLEDLGSKSGTWVQVIDRLRVAHEDIFWMGELYLRVVEVR